MSDLTFPRRRHSVFWIRKKGEQGHNLILQSPVNVMLNNFKISGWTPGSAYTQYSCMWTFHCLQNDILTWPRALLQLAKQHGIAVVDRIQSLIVKFQPKPPLFVCGFQERTPLVYEIDQDTISQSTHNTYMHLHILQIHWSYVIRVLCNAMLMYWWSSEKFTIKINICTLYLTNYFGIDFITFHNHSTIFWQCNNCNHANICINTSYSQKYFTWLCDKRRMNWMHLCWKHDIASRPKIF
jgi:hypothetical protein